MLVFIVLLLITLAAGYEANPSLYANTSVIYREMERLEKDYPSFFKIHKVPQDPEIQYVTLGDRSSKVKGIITCGAHARELLSSEICINYLKSIVKKWDKYPDLYLVVVPVVNKSREKVLKGDLCLRVNERGVDPNRNYPTNFEKGGKRNGSLTYRGPYPLSQKFSQFMDKLLASEEKWNTILDIHTGQLCLYYAEVENQTLNKQTIQLLNKIKRKHCPSCLVDTIQHLQGFIAGEMFKYAATKYQVEHSLEFEIYGGKLKAKVPQPEDGTQERDKNSCMKQFNPNSARSLDFWTKRWVEGVEDVIDLLLELKRNK